MTRQEIWLVRWVDDFNSFQHRTYLKYGNELAWPLSLGVLEIFPIPSLFLTLPISDRCPGTQRFLKRTKLSELPAPEPEFTSFSYSKSKFYVPRIYPCQGAWLWAA